MRHLSSYIYHAHEDGTALSLDVIRPSGRSYRPAVVLLHGGGWRSSSKDSLRDLAFVLAERGYVAIPVQYRLVEQKRHRFPAALQDLKMALRWIRGESPRLGIAPGQIAGLGGSAGAHLAALLGATSLVQAVISIAGPHDLSPGGPATWEQTQLVSDFLGGQPDQVPELARQASPLHQAGAQSAPILLIHGSRDLLVPADLGLHPFDNGTSRRAGSK